MALYRIFSEYNEDGLAFREIICDRRNTVGKIMREKGASILPSDFYFLRSSDASESPPLHRQDPYTIGRLFMKCYQIQKKDCQKTGYIKKILKTVNTVFKIDSKPSSDEIEKRKATSPKKHRTRTK